MMKKYTQKIHFIFYFPRIASSTTFGETDPLVMKIRILLFSNYFLLFGIIHLPNFPLVAHC